MKICVISSHANLYAPRRIMEEGKKRGHEMYLTTWEDIIIELGNGKVYFGDKKKSFLEFDAIIPRSDRYYVRIKGEKISRDLNTVFRLLVEYTKENGIFFLNKNYFSKYQSLDKLAQQFFFFSNNLPGIPTYYFSDKNKLRKSKWILKFPLVSKIAQGSTGTSVFKCENKNELDKFIEERNRDEKFSLFQEYHKIDCDYRVLVAGKKVLGIMKRSAKNGDWRTNFSLGGTVEKNESDKKMEKIARDTAKKMGFDYLGIDILKSNGQFHIIETNSLPQFKGFEKAFPEVNVAEELIKLVELKTVK